MDDVKAVVDAEHTGRALTVIGVVIAVLLALGLWLWALDTGPVRRLPKTAQAALYERTLGTLKEFCDPNKQLEELDEFCRQQADFVLQFPECDDTCRLIASHHHRLQVR